MSSSFVYTPQVDYHNSPYLAPFYHQPNSPFIPELSLSSPYTRNASLPPSPHAGYAPLPTAYSPTQVPFPGSPSDVYPRDPWTRERRPSWHGDGPATSATAGWLSTPFPGYHRQQTRSFGASPFQLPSGLDGYWPPAPTSPYSPYVSPPLMPQITIHPWLNAEISRSDFFFNLSLPHFAPMRYIGNNQTILLTGEELAQPATHPPIYQLTMQCDLIPNWPITLQYNANPYRSANTYPTAPPPITLGDVLSAIHGSLQMGISQYDWATLSPEQVRAISRAYTKRCKAMGSTTMIQNEGVKRVDYLLDKIWFRGLARVGEGLDNLKIIVS